jgi:biopolymer transport protein ExbD
MDAGPSPASTAAPSPFAEDVLIPSKPLVDDARFDVTAMVDLVFMMNIFFLVTWADAALDMLDLPMARHCDAAPADLSVVLSITKGPVVHLGEARPGNALSPGEVDQRVTAAVEEGVREGKKIILIKAEKDVALRDVAHVAGVATAVNGMEQLMLAVIEKK